MAQAAMVWMTTSQAWQPFARLRELLAMARQRARDRAALAQLDERDLRDLQVSRATLAYELNKPFWRG